MWFETLFGRPEPEGDERSAQLRQLLLFDARTGSLASRATGRAFAAGHFSAPSLAELRASAAALTFPGGGGGGGGGLSVDHLAVADALTLHAQHPGAMFQAASQFNCLEFPNWRGAPEHGVTGYMYDRTQGPACALACAAGTVARNDFVDAEGRQGQQGQTAQRQLNLLDGLALALRGGGGGQEEEEEEYFRVRGGYVFAVEDKANKAQPRLRCLDAQIRARREELLAAVRVGVQRDTQVTFAARDFVAPLDGAPITVSQTYCAALSVSYACSAQGMPAGDWAEFATLALEAAYEATLWAAALHAFGPTDADADAPAPTAAPTPHTRDVFLTFLGGGAFGNDSDWICTAMGRALAKLAHVPLRVHVCHYRQLSPQYIDGIARATADAADSLTSKK